MLETARHCLKQAPAGCRRWFRALSGGVQNCSPLPAPAYCQNTPEAAWHCDLHSARYLSAIRNLLNGRQCLNPPQSVIHSARNKHMAASVRSLNCAAPETASP
eukprot:15445288-Alexandrium_andersonii.AAC.1